MQYSWKQTLGIMLKFGLCLCFFSRKKWKTRREKRCSPSHHRDKDRDREAFHSHSSWDLRSKPPRQPGSSECWEYSRPSGCLIHYFRYRAAKGTQQFFSVAYPYLFNRKLYIFCFCTSPGYHGSPGMSTSENKLFTTIYYK